MSNDRRTTLRPTPDRTLQRFADAARLTLAVIGVLVLVTMCRRAHAAPPTPSLPHRPMHEIDIQGHQDLIQRDKLSAAGYCEGHVLSVIEYADGDIVILCYPATLVQGTVVSQSAN